MSAQNPYGQPPYGQYAPPPGNPYSAPPSATPAVGSYPPSSAPAPGSYPPSSTPVAGSYPPPGAGSYPPSSTPGPGPYAPSSIPGAYAPPSSYPVPGAYPPPNQGAYPQSNPAAYPTSNQGSYLQPSTSAGYPPAGQGGNSQSAISGGVPFYGQPQMTAASPSMGYTAPASANLGYMAPPAGGPPSFVTPPPQASTQPGMPGLHASNMPPLSAPITSAYAPPPSVSSPKTNVQFFNVGGGSQTTPTSAAPGFGSPGTGMGMGPPSTGQAGGMPPPPTTTGPPSAFGAPPYGPPGAMPGIPPAGLPGASPGSGAAFHTVPPGMAGAPGLPPISSPSGRPYQDREGGPQPGQPLPGASQLPGIHEMDMSIQCNPVFMRPTVGKIPAQQIPGQGSRIPMGIIIRPMALDDEDPDFVEVVDFGTTGIVRCKRCRTYINPFVAWAENGRRWRCNICGLLNDTPSTYFSHLDNNGMRRDREQRPELNNCSVEFIAPSEYMVRPPQAPVYVFVIDVSAPSVLSGMIESIAGAIKKSLDNLPGDERTQIGFITFDSSVHFFNLAPAHTHPQMMCVSDIDDILLPTPSDLLVNLNESRTIINSFLDSLPDMFTNNQQSESCVGSALAAAQTLMGHIGGKLCLFLSGLCSLGMGSLTMREKPMLMGTDKEHTLLNSEEGWYKNRAIEFSRLQICTELFVCTRQYVDLATIAVLPRYTAGSVYYYPAFYNVRDGPKLVADIERCLTRATAFEAVFRVRATRGLRISHFYGNYFVRGTDLLALPNCSPDSSFAMDIVHDEHVLQSSVVTVQSALLYTSAKGERRIRVHTMVMPVTSNPQEVLDSADVDAIVNLISKHSAEIAMKTGLEQARQRLHQSCVEMLRDPRGVTGPYNPAPQPSVALPTSLQLLPLYVMSLQKNPAFRGGQDIRIDERAYYLQLVQAMSVEDSRVFVYPRMFSIHDMSTECGLPAPASLEVPCAGVDRIRLPTIVNLTYERLSSDGVYLLDTSLEILLRVGAQAHPSILNALFGVSSLAQVDLGGGLRSESSDFTQRLCAIIDALRSERSRFMGLHIVKEGDAPMEAFFARYLVEDRATFAGGNLNYVEYMAYVQRQASGYPG